MPIKLRKGNIVGTLYHDQPSVEITGYHLGMTYHVVANPVTGYRCGYVEIPDTHRLAYKHYDSDVSFPALEVHGGITFSGKHGMFDERVIGFDCAHAGDRPDIKTVNDGMKEFMKKNPSLLSGKVWKVADVAEECKRLINQLV